MPQCGVLERCDEVAAHDTGESANALCENRVAFVGHCGAALLLLSERLEDLAELALLKETDLGRYSLQRSRHRRQRGHEARVPVPGYDLRRHCVRPEAELFADVLLDLRVDRGVRANRPADTTHRHLFGRTVETVRSPVELGHPACHLEAESYRLGDDAVRATPPQRSPGADNHLGRSFP